MSIAFDSEKGNFSGELECGDFPDLQKIEEWKFWIGGVSTLSTGVLGLAGNLVSLYMLICESKFCRHFCIFKVLMSSLCLADLVFLICNLLITPLALGNFNSKISALHPFAECGAHISLSISIFLIISIAIERYQAVCFAHLYSARTAKIGLPCLMVSYICPSIFFGLALNIPKILEISPIGMVLEENVDYLKFYMVYQIFHPLLTTIIIPIIILMVINYNIMKKYPMAFSNGLNLRRRTKNDLILSKVCFAIVTIFIICNVPRLIVGLYEIQNIPTILHCFRARTFYFPPLHQWLADFLARYCVILNSSTNFILYCFVGSKFRKDLFAAISRSSTTNISMNILHSNVNISNV